MTDVVMPQMGESIVEGTLTKWLKKPGDHVERDEPLFEISTDKVDTEIPSPAARHAVRGLGGRGERRWASAPWWRVSMRAAGLPPRLLNLPQLPPPHPPCANLSRSRSQTGDHPSPTAASD